MIFYKNLKKHKKTQEKNILFSIFANGVVSNKDDLLCKPNECKSFYNLSFVDGSLKTGLGFSDLKVPASADDLENCHGFDFASKINEICGIWVDRWFHKSYNVFVHQLMLLDSTNIVYVIMLLDEYDGLVLEKTRKLKSPPLFNCEYRINNQDMTLFFTNEGMVYLGSNFEGVTENVPPIISCVVHYDNFFGITNTNRNTLVYTKNLDLQNWSDEESSTVEFLDNRGSFNKLVSFNDYVYLFREYGITKISIYTAKNDFSFTHLYTSSSKIFEESVCVCGDKIWFMTRDGLYSFTGNSVNKILENGPILFDKLDNRNCSSACLNGKYYFATKCNFDDGKKVGCEENDFVNNVLFEIDINTFDVNVFRGVDIRKVLAIDTPYINRLTACFYNDFKQRVGQLDFSGETFSVSNDKEWKSFSTDLGYRGKRKKIKQICLNSAFDMMLEIISDEETKSFDFSGSEKEQILNVSVCGSLFQFVFKAKGKVDISKPLIVFDVVS